MRRSLFIAGFIFAAALCAMTTPAFAQATRTWVSGVGDDANPCSRTAPCKTFAGAISKTSDGGEIDALDPGGFGALTITGSITIDGGGGQVASVLVAGTNGITVAAGSTDVVTLRNMRIQGLDAPPGSASAGLNGISFTSGAQLNIENCFIQNFSQAGIAFSPNGTGFLNVVDSTIEGAVGGGITVTNNGSGVVKAAISDTNILNSSAAPGLTVNANTSVSVMRSTLSENNSGVKATGTGALVMIAETLISGSPAIGIHGVSNAMIALAESTITLNGTGIVATSGGTVQSFGNNMLFGNVNNGAFTTPALQPMMLRRSPPR